MGSPAALLQGGCERTLRCCLPNLRKPGIIQDHLRSAAMVLSAPVHRHARLVKVEDDYQLLLGNADLVRDRVVIGITKLHQVALPIVKPQLYVVHLMRLSSRFLPFAALRFTAELQSTCLGISCALLPVGVWVWRS